jgi:mono/diheme cytochrome c family protein
MRSDWMRPRNLVVGGLLVATAAYASPWDIDMIDGVNFKAYEWKMRTPPEGSVQRESPTRPRPLHVGSYQDQAIAQFDRTTPEGQALVNPYPVNDATVAQGKRLFGVYCTPCHGPEGKGGGAVTYNDPAKDIRRFPVPAPLLSGPGAVTAQRSDGYVYLALRNGGAVMPGYGLATTDAERWAIVAYIRTLDGGAFVPPPDTTDAGGTP